MYSVARPFVHQHLKYFWIVPQFFCWTVSQNKLTPIYFCGTQHLLRRTEKQKQRHDDRILTLELWQWRVVYFLYLNSHIIYCLSLSDQTQHYKGRTLHRHCHIYNKPCEVAFCLNSLCSTVIASLCFLCNQEVCVIELLEGNIPDMMLSIY